MYWHVWFGTKYRRQTLTGEVADLVEKVLSERILRHGFEVLEFGIGVDHMHLLFQARDKSELSAIARTLKAVSAREALRMLRESNEGGLYDAFWARRYGYRQIEGHEIQNLREYVRGQGKGGTHATGGSL